jgi:hypothetical protein
VFIYSDSSTAYIDANNKRPAARHKYGSCSEDVLFVPPLCGGGRFFGPLQVRA